MQARLRERDHVDFGAVRVVVEVGGLPWLGPVRSHFAYGYVVEVFEHVVERYPEAAVVVEEYAELRAYVVGPFAPAVGPVAFPLFVAPWIAYLICICGELS